MLKSTTSKIDLDRIVVPTMFKSRIPDPEKIAARVKAYKTIGAFDREIIVDEEYTLVDGYTTYLVCKMLGIKKTRVLRIKIDADAVELAAMLHKKIAKGE
jgi:hypothetical protein